jgi:hypothetical protein
LSQAPTKSIKEESIDLSLGEDDAEDEAQIQRLRVGLISIFTLSRRSETFAFTGAFGCASRNARFECEGGLLFW